jgi:TRAP transporter TAXI family solute receptor
VTDLANSPGVTIQMIDHAELVPAMNTKWGELYVKDTISKDVYRGMASDNQQATVTNLLVAHQSMDEQTAYNVVKAIFENREELIRVHKEAANFVLEKQKTSAAGGIPWHPGALKYFKEKGVKLD